MSPHYRSPEGKLMNTRSILAATMTIGVLALTSGCAVHRGQESVGNYIDDAAITTSVKARFIDNNDVDAASIKVETLHGVVMLSGFAKNAEEKATAERIARGVDHVKSVKNELAIHKP